MEISLGAIKVLHPRKYYDQKKMDDLTRSVKEQGVMQPIIVRMRHDKNYELMAGSRRLMAAIAAGLEKIPAIMRAVSDGQAIEICVTENLQRDDIHELEEAEGYRELLELPGYVMSTVAAKVGKDESYVHRRLKLLDLIKKAQESFLKGEMTAEHAVMIARLQPDDQEKAFEALFMNDFGYRDPGERRARTAKSLKAWIADNIMLKVSAAKFKTSDPSLIAGVPACENCPKRTGFNKTLFNDIKEKDLCTDPGCYAAKTQAHITQAISKAEAAEKPLVRISSHYELRKHGEGDPLPTKEYQIVDRKKKCSSMEKAIYVHGDTDLGQQVSICRDPKCSVHGRNITGHSADADKWKREAEKRDREARIKKTTRRQIMETALKQIKAPIYQSAGSGLHRPLYELAVIGIWNGMWNDLQKSVAAHHNWPAVKKSGGYGIDWDTVIRKGIGPLEDVQLDQLLLELTMVKQLDYVQEDGKDRIMEFAGLMKIDPKEIATRVRAEITERAKAKQKKLAKAKRQQAKAGAAKSSAKPEVDDDPVNEEDDA
jgi:ParB family chromosome partitioning protein